MTDAAIQKDEIARSGVVFFAADCHIAIHCVQYNP